MVSFGLTSQLQIWWWEYRKREKWEGFRCFLESSKKKDVGSDVKSTVKIEGELDWIWNISFLISIKNGNKRKGMNDNVKKLRQNIKSIF